MTVEAATPVATDYEGPAPQSQPRTLARQALVDTFSRWGARIGTFWLAIVLLAGVFAPFIANSHPIAFKQNGQWSSPMIRHLTSTDVIVLVVALVAGAMLLTRRFTFGQMLAWTLWIMAVTVPVITWPTWPYPKLFLTTLANIASPIALLAGALMIGLLVLAIASRRWRLLGWIGFAVVLVAYFFLGGPRPFTKLLFQALAIVVVTFLLLHVAIIVLVPLRSRVSRSGKAMIALAGLAVVIITIIHPIHPPEAVSYSRYREDVAAGMAEKAVTTLIPYSPSDRQRDYYDPQQNLPPGPRHWMGTTPNGEDVLSRMIYGCRIAISIGFISTGIAVIIGCFIGGLMGYFVGKVDIFGMRLIEVFEAIPTLFLLITFVAFYGRDLYIMMAIIGLTSWTGNARFIRAEFLRLRKQDFVQAAIAAGLPLRSLLFRHMLPNGIAPVLVTASFGVASAILAESTLSFLGLGLIDEPSWGQMLNQARGVGTDFLWWMAIFPGGAIFLTVFSYNLIGESLRDALDPKLRKRD
jgi:peptide/nickel transport system permease protein